MMSIWGTISYKTKSGERAVRNVYVFVGAVVYLSYLSLHICIYTSIYIGNCK